MVQHKFIVAKESIPDQYVDAYTNVQVPSVLIYNGFMVNNPSVQLPPPTVVQRPPIPPEIAGTFTMCDQLIETVLGSYDASLGINNNQLSGVAIVEGATQSNAAAMPYVVGYMQSFNQVAKVVLNLIPKYVNTPRTIPVIGIDGKRTFKKVNEQGTVNFSYESNNLNVKVEPGVNFAIQKNRALSNIIQLMQASPLFAQFINDVGLEVLLDNVEIRGIDQLKVMAENWMKQQAEVKKQQEQMQQQAMQNNPMVIKAKAEEMKAQAQIQKISHDIQHSQIEDQQIATKNAVESQKQENDRLEILARTMSSQREQLVKEERIQAERMRSAVDVLLDASKHEHQKHTDHRHHDREDIKLHLNNKKNNF
jgi:hypothetical protein